MKLSSAIISTALSCALLLLPLQATAAEDDKAKLARPKERHQQPGKTAQQARQR